MSIIEPAKGKRRDSENKATVSPARFIRADLSTNKRRSTIITFRYYYSVECRRTRAFRCTDGKGVSNNKMWILIFPLAIRMFLLCRNVITFSLY